MDTLGKRLKASFNNYYDRNAVFQGGADALLYGGLYERSIHVAGHLKQSSPGRYATIIMRNPTNMLTAVFGCIWCHIPFQILDVALLSAREGSTPLLEDSFLFLDQASDLATERDTVRLDDIGHESALGIQEPDHPSEALFYMLLFCGANRYQKVFYNRDDILQSALHCMNLYQFQKGDGVLFLTPTVNAVCIPRVLAALLSGASIAFAADELQALDFLSSGQIHHVFTAPDLLKSLADAGDKQDFSTLQNIILSTDEKKMDPTLINRCKTLNASASVYSERNFSGAEVPDHFNRQEAGRHLPHCEAGNNQTHHGNLHGVFFDISFAVSQINHMRDVEQCRIFTDCPAGKHKFQIFLLIREPALEHDIVANVSEMFPPCGKLDFYFTHQQELWPDKCAPKEEFLAVCQPYSYSEEQYTDPVDRALYDMWKQLLKVENIQKEDKFFDLGGNSFLITKLFTQIKKQFSISMDFMDLYRNNTLGQMCNFVRKRYKSI